MNIQDAAVALRAGKTSSAALTAAALDRIREENPRLNAIQTPMEESANERARRPTKNWRAGWISARCMAFQSR